jgi:hypothetical protein
MKEQEKAKRLLRFTQGVTYDSSDAREIEKSSPEVKADTREDKELRRLGIRPLDSQIYADKLVKDAGLADQEEVTAEFRGGGGAIVSAAAAGGGPKSGAVIFSASAPGFTRSSRDGGAVDVSDAGKLTMEGVGGGGGGSLDDYFGPSGGGTLDEEDTLTGKIEYIKI